MDPAAPPESEPDGEQAVQHFLHAAQLCRVRDLQQLAALGELVAHSSALVHSLQRERGASAIFVGSGGAQFGDRLRLQISESQRLERQVRAMLRRLDADIGRLHCAASFYTRVALALRALDAARPLREQVITLATAAQDAINAFTDIIGALLALNFEVADIAAHPVVSRALVALVSFVQGKEFAGQERATAGAAFSHGSFSAADQRRLQQLIAAQDQAFQLFARFADQTHVTAHQVTHDGPHMASVRRLRSLAFGDSAREALTCAADSWFEHTTGRIDAMKAIEDQMTEQLSTLCRTLVQSGDEPVTSHEQLRTNGAPIAVLIAASGLDASVDLVPVRPILDLLQAQSRRIDDVSHQLEAARQALDERKTVDRAKGVLMKSRRLSEQQAYKLLRDTAMKQNKRIIDVAEAILSMADLFKD
jgi:hypothetical protein